MSQHPTLLQQFRSFCFQNKITDLEKAVEYFAVFGGMGWYIDISKPLDRLIEEKVLNNYRYIHAEITTITQSNQTHHRLLSALSVGDRREHSAFKRAKLGRIEGEKSIDFLLEKGMLVLDKPQEKPIDENEEVSDKFLFVQPFMRFWFSCVSPYYKGIKSNDYDEFTKQWTHIKQGGFSDYILERLVLDLVKNSFNDDPIVSIGSYWDKNVEIDILAKTKSGRMIAGSCKYSKAKAGKSELSKLKESCKKAELNIDTFVIFSKNKFSNELKKEKGEELKLFSMRNIKVLMDDLSRKDILVNTNKKF